VLLSETRTWGKLAGAAPVKIHRIRFESNDLQKMPEQERVLTMLLGHIANEINILQKLIMMAHNLNDEPCDTEIQGRTANTMCLLRVLLGKLNEAHHTIKARYVRAGLHAKLQDDFDEQIRTCFKEFMNYFERPSNNINVLRKKVAFHYDWEFARRNLRSLPSDVSLSIYTDETVGNTFFQFADFGVAWMMANHVQPGEFASGLDVITDEALELAKNFIRFSTACLGLLLRSHVPFVEEEWEVHPTCGLEDARISFFMTRD
jgi:hypothetical protein